MVKQPGFSLLKWTLTKALILTGWMGFLRVSELIGSGKAKGKQREGPSGLDVCDVRYATVEGKRCMCINVRSAKNDQTAEGEETVVYEDELNEGVCAISRVQQWTSMAGLKMHPECTKGKKGCKVCMRAKCICDCKHCGKLFRNVVQGKLQAAQVSRTGLTRILRDMYGRLEEEGEVEMGTAEEVSGISLRAGGVTEAAAAGIERELLAGHGRWRSLSGPEQYDRNDKRKFRGVSDALHRSMHIDKKRRQLSCLVTQ